MSRGKIIVGVDGSDHAGVALRWALAHAELLDWSVEAVFAWQLPLIAMPGAFDRDEMEKAAKSFLVETVSSLAPTPRVPLGTLVAEGDPTAALVEATKGADLLVLGTRGRTPFRGLLLGSVSQGCAATAHCPTVIIKPNDFST